MDRAYQDILGYVDTLEIIDTHEHLPGTEAARPEPSSPVGKGPAEGFSS